MLNVEMTETADGSGVKTKLNWMPNAKVIQSISEELAKQNYGNSLATLMADALADLTIVVQGFKDFIEKELGKKSAEIFEKTITEHPELLFKAIPKDARIIIKEDIRNADFY